MCDMTAKQQRQHYREVSRLQRRALLARARALRAHQQGRPAWPNLIDLANLRVREFRIARAWYFYQWDIGQDTDDMFVMEG